MNDEIKEILDNMFHIIMKYEEDFEDLEENEIRYQLPYNKMQKLYDYIINLQQENERLKERVAYLERSNNRREDTIIGLRFEVAEQEDYKSRCEKASEKLGNYKHYSTPTEEQNSENEDIVDSALNILQNGSDEDE